MNKILFRKKTLPPFDSHNSQNKKTITMGLLDGVKGMMTNAVVDKVSDVLGIENGMMKTAVKMFLPAIIGGVINKGSSTSGAGGLLDLFKNGGYGDDNLGDIMGVLGNEDKRGGWLDTGADLLGNIFGNSQAGVLDMLISKTGLGKGVGGMLLKFLAPLVINKLAGIVSNKNLDANGLSSYLNDQKSDVMGLVPGLSGILNGGASTNIRASANSGSTSEDGGGMGFLKWLLPLALVGLAAWYFTQGGCNKKAETTAPLTEESTTESTIATDLKAKEAPMEDTSRDAKEAIVKSADFTGYDINDNLDIVTASGAVLYSSGSYDIDARSNVLDSSGKVVMPALTLPEAFKTKLSSMFDRIRLARMKMMFGNMIIKKEGSNTSYALSDIKFKKEGHRIEGFSKAEVEGLAAALQSNATGKIEVHVHTADGKNDKENAEFADKRANVIRDMLVTLGVNKDQISAIGKGNEDAVKAKDGKVDIVVK